MAMPRALVTSGVAWWLSIDQPTTRRRTHPAPHSSTPCPRGWVFGDVGHPQLVRCWPVESALDQVSGGRDVGLAADQPPGSWQPTQAVAPHDLADCLAVDDHAVAVCQLG